MNREDIIRMAREAGYGLSLSDMHAPALERFAALVADVEREACAKVCERLATWNTALAIVCADSIRARSKE